QPGISDMDAKVLDWARGGGERSIEISLSGLRIHREERGLTARNVVRESRALEEGTYAGGDALVPQSFRSVLYQHLIMNSAVRQTRATVITTDSGEPLVMPKTTAHPAAGTVSGEGATINEQDPTFGAGTVSAYKYANLIPVSTELLQDSGVDLLGYLAMAMGRALAIGSGADFITGSGTGKPQGIVTGAGTVAQVVGGTGQGGSPNYLELEDVYDAIIPPYQREGEWVFSQKMASNLRRLVDTLGRPLWVPSLSGDMPDTLLGKPFYLDPAIATPAINAVSMVFGDWSTYFIRDVSGLRFERSLDFGFDKDLVYYRAIIRTDGRLLDDTGSVSTYKGGTA
ncbi:MAG: phage major capsid protein, partial [Bradyrhizobium sp.]|nr:phage major capsid protein [Bradyrhizobium sp.]